MLNAIGHFILDGDGFLIGFAVCLVTLVPLAWGVAWFAGGERALRRVRAALVTGNPAEIDEALGADAGVDATWGTR